jgi:hypothetical protein
LSFSASCEVVPFHGTIDADGSTGKKAISSAEKKGDPLMRIAL